MNNKPEKLILKKKRYFFIKKKFFFYRGCHFAAKNNSWLAYWSSLADDHVELELFPPAKQALNGVE